MLGSAAVSAEVRRIVHGRRTAAVVAAVLAVTARVGRIGRSRATVFATVLTATVAAVRGVAGRRVRRRVAAGVRRIVHGRRSAAVISVVAAAIASIVHGRRRDRSMDDRSRSRIIVNDGRRSRSRTASHDGSRSRAVVHGRIEMGSGRRMESGSATSGGAVVEIFSRVCFRGLRG
jgi:hypothetical protein